MLDAAVKGEFDVLLLWDLSRFARDLVEQETVCRRFARPKIRIVTIKDGYDSERPGGKLQRTVNGMTNEQYLENLGKDTHRGLEGAAKRGLSVGGRAYGYRSEPIMDELGKITGFRVLPYEEHAARGFESSARSS